jgi:putative redox protein
LSPGGAGGDTGCHNPRMPVPIDLAYEGDLHCTLTHGPSGTEITTDAPRDNRGKGAAFSPTDLVGAALGSCMLTTMGIVARDRGWNIDGATAHVEKDMGSTPRRHIAKLTMMVTMPKALDADARGMLEETARTCPVASSLGDKIEVDLSFRYA